MIKTFVSYHHALDQSYKDALVSWASREGIIDDYSVNTGEINDSLSGEQIRRKIRDEYLRDSEVTILLLGKEARYRKHVDWELKSTMIDGKFNKRSGILVVNLPTAPTQNWSAAYSREKEVIYPGYQEWVEIKSAAEYEIRHPSLPRRIIENMLKPGVKISIVQWDAIYCYRDRFQYLLAETAVAGRTNPYDLSRPMRMKNFNPVTETFDARV